jgi:hypothetical protein
MAIEAMMILQYGVLLLKAKLRNIQFRYQCLNTEQTVEQAPV